ncbi:Secretion system effector C (SseC) like family protein [Cupriavidus sp. YR651]|uniref:type III secretion system translocon subunit SctE n=1 Tax=Cupriavidus sp. YR651 TaxID=1855315 RepID=UPI000882CC06|nr:type III secretion system translocon subunit SctE [Cupriavidus sp. YR651]SDD38488.1 Secretion system effector C (SseC) like family protein [Cupriavidus sp. YR651]
MKIDATNHGGYPGKAHQAAEAPRLNITPDFQRLGADFVVAATEVERRLAKQKTAAAGSDGRLAPPSIPFRDAVLLLSRVVELVEQSTLDKLALNAETAGKVRQEIVAANAKLAAQYEAAVHGQGVALAALAAILPDALGLATSVATLKARLAELQSALASTTPGSAGHDQLLLEIDALKRTLAMQEVALGELLQAARDAEAANVDAQKQVDALFEEAVRIGVDLQKTVIEEDKSNLARILALMSALGELLLQSGEVRAETQSELLRVQEEVRIAKLRQDAEKYDKDLAKSEAMNKAMGCVGKILGAVVTAVAFVGAIFTGGASLAIAGIGVALMLADTVTQAVTGKSFLEEALKPIMAVIQPILQFLMDRVADILKGFGVSAEVARMVSMIAVSIAMAGAVVVAMVAGLGGVVGSAAARLASRIGSALARGIQRTIGRLIPEAVKRAVSGAAQSLSGTTLRLFDAASKRLGLATDTVSTQIRGARTIQAAAWMNLASTTATGALDIGAGTMQLRAAKLLASMNLGMKDLQILEEMLKSMTELLATSMDSATAAFARLSQVIQEKTLNGTAIARAMQGSRAV